VSLHARREPQALGQLFRKDLLRVIADDEMHFMLRHRQIVEQPLGIKGATGTCDGNENSHVLTKGNFKNRPPEVQSWQPTLARGLL
jgi:hypothetical protein